MVDENTPVYMISVVARLVGVHPQTLRFYESEGLLKPSRTAGKTRLYSEKDLKRARKIVSLTREKGVNVAGVELILNLEEELEELFRMMSKLNRDIKEQILAVLRELECQELDIERLITILEGRRKV